MRMHVRKTGYNELQNLRDHVIMDRRQLLATVVEISKYH